MHTEAKLTVEQFKKTMDTCGGWITSLIAVEYNQLLNHCSDYLPTHVGIYHGKEWPNLNRVPTVEQRQIIRNAASAGLIEIDEREYFGWTPIGFFLAETHRFPRIIYGSKHEAVEA